MTKPHVLDLTPALGAEITGIDPGNWLDSDTVRLIRDAFDDRGLLLFRGVDLDREHQYYLSEILRGQEPPSPEEAEAGAARQGGFWISNKEPDAAAPFGRLLFHCDGMWSDEPFEVLSLYAVDVHPPVLPTMFASSAYGWDTLPAEQRIHLSGLHGLHVTGPEYIHERRRRAFDGELSQPHRDHVPLITAPIAHRHPRTGRPLLYATQGMTREILELTSEESEDLLEELFAHLYHPEHIYEHEWCNGDLILWDNLAIQHARPNVELDGPVRTLRKIGLPVPQYAEAQQVNTYQQVS